jgi:hypothetical protein
MAGFLYYAPGRQRPLTTADATEQALCDLGLEHLATAIQSRAVMNHGPDGGCGLLFAPTNSVKRLGYHPDAQEWRQGPACWVGWEGENPPTPEDLARDTQLPGVELTLADGQTWTVPVAQFWDGRTQLPCVYGLQDGNAVPEVVPALRPFQKAVEAFLAEWKASLAEGRLPACDEDALFDLAGLALSLNYRVGRWELLARGLLQTQPYGGHASVWDVCTATFDWPAVRKALQEHSKKNESEGPGASGATDSSRATDRQ